MAELSNDASEADLRAVLDVLPGEVADRVWRYQPQAVPADAWDAVRAFVLRVIGVLAPQTWSAAEKQVQAITRLAAWCWHTGVPLTETTVFTGDRVESFRAHLENDPGERARVQGTSAADYAARLRSIGMEINPGAGWPVPTGVGMTGSRRSLSCPYSDAEVAALDLAISTMPEGRDRLLADTVLCAGLGFGPQPGELRSLLTAHIVPGSGGAGAWAEVPGPRARRVPIADPWAGRLTAITSARGQGPLIAVTAGTNALGESLSRIRLGRGVPTLTVGRLRTTWMVQRLRAGVDARLLLLEYAGLATLNNLIDLYDFLPSADRTTALAAMTAAVGP